MINNTSIQACIEHFQLPRTQNVSFTDPGDAYEYLKLTQSISESELLSFFAENLNLPYKTLQTLIIDPSLLTPKNHLSFYKNRVIPLYKDEEGFCIAVDTPFPKQTDFLSGLEKETPLSFQLIQGHELTQFWTHWFERNTAPQEKNTQTPSLPTALLSILKEAHLRQASDIHLHQTHENAHIHFRCAGVLLPYTTLRSDAYEDLLQVIKYHAKIPLGRSQKPQNGQLIYTIAPLSNHPYDARVSLLPTIQGCDSVIRLFGNMSTKQSLSELGFNPHRHDMITRMLQQRHGLILVTGPTGSGKTTTLYAMLHKLNQRKDTLIITIEDPVETIVDTLRQTQINTEHGYDFKDAFKACLRQDPDVILIGEIRDAETAKLVIEAAYSGHLILATLHTNNCENTLKRLCSFKLDSFLLGYCLKGIISQQLMGVSCKNCQNTGCETCQYSGISGRKLISELMSIQSPLPITSELSFTDLKTKNLFIPFEKT